MKREEIPQKIKLAIEDISAVFSIIDMKAFYETAIEDGELVKKFVSHQISYRSSVGVRFDTVLRLEK